MSQTNENGSSAKTNIIDVFGNDTSRFMLPAFVIGTAAPYLFCSGMFARTVDQLAESRVADLLVSRLDVFASAMTRLAAVGDTHSARALTAALSVSALSAVFFVLLGFWHKRRAVAMMFERPDAFDYRPGSRTLQSWPQDARLLVLIFGIGIVFPTAALFHFTWRLGTEPDSWEFSACTSILDAVRIGIAPALLLWCVMLLVMAILWRIRLGMKGSVEEWSES